MQVPLLDLRLQYQSLKDSLQPLLGELFDSQQFILGPHVLTLEQNIADYCGASYAVGVTSGTDALLLALMAIDVQPGDKVITTPYTFFATAGSIARLGGIPVFVDIDPETYTMDPQQVENLLAASSDQDREKIKAIMPVHLYGQCADMQPILDVARKYNLKVIEDAAQALGAAYLLDGKATKACARGDFGCLSFFPSKNLGCFGDGGMITTNDDRIARKLRSLRVHGQTEGYYHEYIGINGRLDALQALVLQVKLPYLDGWAARRKSNAAYYEKLFTEAGLLDYVVPPRTRTGATHVYNQFVVRVRERDGLKQHLDKQGIGTAIYYPLPLHLQTCFKYLGYAAGDFPESERASRETLALPVFPELTRAQLEYVVEQIGKFYRG